jgi:hypothetical protein
MTRRFLIALGCLLFPLFAIAREPGVAKGTISFNGKPKNLAYAYAWMEPSQSTKGQVNTVVVLSDTKLDDATLADHFAMIALARKGTFTGVQVTFDAKGDPKDGTFYTAEEDGYFGATGMHKWVKKTMSPLVIEGKLSTDAEHHFFKTSYSYSADFKAAIGPAPRK